MRCRKCKVPMQVHTVGETKRRGIFTILIYIVLLFIPNSKIKAISYAICPSCGRRRKL
jgi:hypothetical protein